MSRVRGLGSLLAVSLTLAACSGIGGTFMPGASPTGSPAAGAAASNASKVLSETSDAVVIQEAFPGTGKVWLTLPFRTFQITVGGAHQMKARLFVRSAADAAVPTWTSSDPSVATVVRGQIVGKKLGTTTITVEAGGEKARMLVAVVSEVSTATAAFGGGTDGASPTTGEVGTVIEAVATLPGEMVYGRRGAYAVSAGGNEFRVIGGSDGTKPLNTVEFAPFIPGSTGSRSLGAFVLMTDGFIRYPREGLAAILIAGYYYIFGGEGQGLVERTTRSVENGLFETLPSTLDTPRRYMSKLYGGDWVMLIGGESSTLAPLATVEYAKLNQEPAADESAVGDFGVVPGVAMITPRAGAGSAQAGQYVYVFGGMNDRSLETVERAQLQPGGLGAFEAVPDRSLVVARSYFSTVITSNAVYVIGGMGATDVPVDSIERATISPEGALGPFEIVGYLEQPRYKASAALLGNALAVAGGQTPDGVTRDVEVIPIESLVPGAVPPTRSPSPSPTGGASATPTASPTAAPTATPSATPSASPS